MSYKVLLIKILPECWVNEFLDGNLYLNTNMYFSNLDESDRVRFAPFDCIDQSRQVKEISIPPPGGDWTLIGGIINPVVFSTQNVVPPGRTYVVR
jgi:hypothetical protein